MIPNFINMLQRALPISFKDTVGFIFGDNNDSKISFNGLSFLINTSVPAFIKLDSLVQFEQTSVTIATGEITQLSSYAVVDTQDSDPTDDLDTVFFTSTIFSSLILRSTNDARDPTVKDGSPIKMAGDFTLSSTQDSIWLQQSKNSSMSEISRSDNA